MGVRWKFRGILCFFWRSVLYRKFYEKGKDKVRGGYREVVCVLGCGSFRGGDDVKWYLVEGE